MIDYDIVRDFIKDFNEKIDKHYKEFDVALVISKIVDKEEKDIDDNLIKEIYHNVDFKDSLWDKEFEDEILDLANSQIDNSNSFNTDKDQEEEMEKE